MRTASGMLVKCEEAMAGETASRARPEGSRGFGELPEGLAIDCYAVRSFYRKFPRRCRAVVDG